MKTFIQEHGLDIETSISYEEIERGTFLHVAVYQSDEELVKYLLGRNADVNKYALYRNANYNSPLHIAVLKNNLPIVKELIYYGADVNGTYNNSMDCETPLISAIRSNNLETVKFLIETGANFKTNEVQSDPFDFLLLYYAFKLKSNNIIDFYLNESTQINYKSESYGSLLNCAVNTHDVNLVERVLNYGADINAASKVMDRPLTPLQTAISINTHASIVKLLIYRGADVNARAYFSSDIDDFASTLQFAMDFYMRDSMVSKLLDAGADISNKNGYYDVPFHYTGRDVAYKKRLKKHVVKLDVANFKVSKYNRKYLKDKKLEMFRMKCCEQIEEMKRIRIENTHVTFYDLLTMSDHRLGLYAKDSNNIIATICKREFESRCHLYAGIVAARLRKGVERRELLLRAETFICNTLCLPNTFVRELVHYFSDEDLKMMLS